MIAKIKNLMTGMQWWEKGEYIALIAMMASLPIAWRLSMWSMIATVAFGVCGIVSTRRVGNPQLGKGQKVGLWLMVAFFAIYLASACYSTNSDYGWRTATGKLPFLLLPLTILLGDTAFLTKERIKGIFYTLWAMVLLRFAVAIVVAGVRFATGTPLSGLMEENFINIHHSYISLYAVVAASFGYTEIMRQIKRSGWNRKCWMHVAALIAFTLLTVLTNSRAGMIYMALLILVFAIDWTTSTKRVATALTALLVAIAAGVAVYQVIPKEYKRFTYAIREIRAGRSGDCRPLMIRSGLEAAKSHWVFGYGSGDYEEPLQEQFLKNGFQEGYDRKFGSHNQYIETLLECGAVGLGIMAAMLFAPLFIERKHRGKSDKRLTAIVIAAVAIEIFFESILGRQMGILFVALLYILLIVRLGNGDCDESEKLRNIKNQA